jgi:glyoxylase-like metal-dependent hydrolase (beta-lactamase superfamily II)
VEIIPKVHLVPGLKGANAYLLLGDPLTLVDTGMPGSEETILSYVEGLGLAAGDLARIVITHHHLDHVGSLAALKQRTAAQVLAHPGDAPFISGAQPAPPARSTILRLVFRLLGSMLPRADPAPVDVVLQDGDHLDTFAPLSAGTFAPLSAGTFAPLSAGLLGGATVVHVPGHTAGSIALHFPAERLLICGDVIDHRRNRLGPPPKPFTDDMDQAVASLRRLAELEFDVLCPGHGVPVVGGADEQVRAMVRALG